MRAVRKVRNARLALIGIIGAVVLLVAWLAPETLPECFAYSEFSQVCTARDRRDSGVRSAHGHATTITTIAIEPFNVNSSGLPRQPQDSPEHAASNFCGAWSSWIVSPNPATWLAIQTTVVPEMRGTLGGDWPWGPPILFLDAVPAPPGIAEGDEVEVDYVLAEAESSDEEEAARHLLVSVGLTVHPEEGGVSGYLISFRLTVRYVEAEETWLVSSADALTPREEGWLDSEPGSREVKGGRSGP